MTLLDKYHIQNFSLKAPSKLLYTIRQRFTNLSVNWESYIEFSGFSHIAELITLDSMVCPSSIGEIRKEDWNYNVNEDGKTELFNDLNYLLQRDPIDAASQVILGIVQSPHDCLATIDDFEFCGFDIMDSSLGNSTLTNCGKIPDIFVPADLNGYGLVSELDNAYAIRDRMRAFHPDDPHLGNCEVWQISKLRTERLVSAIEKASFTD